MKKVIKRDGIELASQSFGHPGDPPVVLIMGATVSMLGWPEAFCRMLAARGCFVVRYDNRDTGESTTGAVGQLGYTLEDMAEDLLRVMDGHGLEDAHVVGMSLGGMLAQLAALMRPQRVRSLTLFASEPLGWDGAPLPSISPAFNEQFASMDTLDWTDRAAVLDFMVEDARLCAGPRERFDPVSTRQAAQAELERSSTLQAAFNHGLIEAKRDWTGRFRDIRQPTLVIHGTADPILPLANGVALAEGISGATLTTLEGLGHELAPWAFAEMVDLIDRHVQQRRP